MSTIKPKRDFLSCSFYPFSREKRGPIDVGLGTITMRIPTDDRRTPVAKFSEAVSLARMADEPGYDSVWYPKERPGPSAEQHGAGECYFPPPWCEGYSCRTLMLEYTNG